MLETKIRVDVLKDSFDSISLEELTAIVETIKFLAGLPYLEPLPQMKEKVLNYCYRRINVSRGRRPLNKAVLKLRGGGKESGENTRVYGEDHINYEPSTSDDFFAYSVEDFAKLEGSDQEEVVGLKLYNTKKQVEELKKERLKSQAG